MEANRPATNRRLLDYELLRGLAIFCVIFNHTAADGFFLFANYTPGPRYWLYMVCTVVCKVGAPLFLAISGALLLPRAEEPDTRLLARFGRIAAALAVFSLLVYFQLIALGYEPGFTLARYLTRLYDERWLGAYWYLYAYLVFLLALPFLRALANHLASRYFVWLALLALVLQGLVPVAQYLVFRGEHTLNLYFNDACWFLNTVVLYPLLGYWVEHRVTPAALRRALPWLWLGCAAAVALTCGMTAYQAAVTGVCNEDQSQTFLNCFTPLYCVALFAAAKVWLRNAAWPRPLAAAVTSLGRCSFGIYLIHYMVFRLPVMDALFAALRSALPPLPLVCVLLYCLAALLLSWLATALLRRVPLVNKML